MKSPVAKVAPPCTRNTERHPPSDLTSDATITGTLAVNAGPAACTTPNGVPRSFGANVSVRMRSIALWCVRMECGWGEEGVLRGGESSGGSEEGIRRTGWGGRGSGGSGRRERRTTHMSMS
jgi:hypothetical protein